MLYPSIDYVRPNYHGNKTKITKPAPKPKEDSPKK